MKVSRHFVLLFAMIASCFLISCADRTDGFDGQKPSVPDPAPSVEPTSTAEIATQEEPTKDLIERASDLANPDRADSAERLIELAKSSDDAYASISEGVARELRAWCDPDDILVTGEQFTKIRSLAMILGELRDPGSLGALIDCSSRRSATGGLSLTNHPTIDAIVKFGDSAIPSLVSKYRGATDAPTKCRLASIIARIGGPKASKDLEILRIDEADGPAKKCLKSSLRASETKDRK